MKNKVVVIIPIYKPRLSAYDRISISRTCDILKDHPLVVIHPEGLDISAIAAEFPVLKFRSFTPDFFRGIMGYNRLMLSSEFYKAFLDYEYLLICQTDVYIFRDELEKWCDAGYDYIGAPWLKKRVYSLPFIKELMKISLLLDHKKGIRSKQDLYGKIGNGGLSLRKVSSHYQTVISMQDTISRYVNRDKKIHLFNEDVFWALEPKNFSYPPVDIALQFSFDKYPRFSFVLNGRRLPFGCHAWYSSKMRGFWKRTVPESFPTTDKNRN